MAPTTFNPLDNRSRIPVATVHVVGGFKTIAMAPWHVRAQAADVPLPEPLHGARRSVPLSQHRLLAMPAAAAGTAALDGAARLGRAINLIEATRGAPLPAQAPGRSGPLTPAGERLRLQTLAIGEALALLSSGPPVHAGTIAAMEQLTGLSELLVHGMQSLREAWREERPESNRVGRLLGELPGSSETGTLGTPVSEEIAGATEESRHDDADALSCSDDSDRSTTDFRDTDRTEATDDGTSAEDASCSEDDASWSETEPDDPERAEELRRTAEVLQRAVEHVERGGEMPRAGDAVAPGARLPRSPDDEAFDLVASMSRAVLDQLEERGNYLAAVASQGPRLAANMYTGKAQLCAAAADMLDQRCRPPRLPDGTHGAGLRSAQAAPLRTIARNLRARGQALEEEAALQAGREAEPRSIEGRPPIAGFFNKLLHLPTVLRQRASLARWVERLTRPRPHIGGQALKTPDIDEQTIVEATLVQAYRQAGLPPGQAIGDYRAALAERFARRDWAPIHDEIQLQVGSETVFAYSLIEPSGSRRIGGAGRDGVSSLDAAQGERVVNLARTRLKDASGQLLFSGYRHAALSAWGIAPDAVQASHMSDERLTAHVATLLPEQLVRGAGDAINAGFTAAGVRGDPAALAEMRRIANQARAEDLLGALIEADEPMKARARAAVPYASGHAAAAPPPLRVLSISLFSPGHAEDGQPDEAMMLEDQRAAWQQLQGVQTLYLPSVGASRLDIEVVDFNHPAGTGDAGVSAGAKAERRRNDAALERLLGSRQAPTAWHEAQRVAIDSARSQAVHLRGEREELETALRRVGQPRGAPADVVPQSELSPAHRAEQEALRELMTRKDSEIADFEARLFAYTQELALVDSLVEQVRTLRAHGPREADPYALPARLALLAPRFGFKVAFSCATGHGRAGDLDAEIKHLALQIEMSGRAPSIDGPASAQEQAHRRAVFGASGNAELQRLNTGYAGYRRQGFPDDGA